MGNTLKKFYINKMVSQPIIVVLGCTGTGKSKLSIELAKMFNGEIISADSMQVYKGLDIITNKVTNDEQSGIKHHCLDFIDPLSRYTVVDFQKKALPIIYDVLKREKLPIIVGGTNYYIESILWDVLIKSENESGELLYELDKNHEMQQLPDATCDNGDIQNVLKQTITQNSVDLVSNEFLHKCLLEVDPAMAKVIHFNDRRKVIRSLQVYQQTGTKHSDLLAQQRSINGGSSLGGPLRFKNVIMFWIQCEKEVLKKRLDDRVETMINKGLISELLDFHTKYNKSRVSSEKSKYNEGIFQSIGFKEFHNYLILSEEERNTEIGKKLFQKGVEDMQLVTRQYSRKQEKWIRNRFLRKPDRQVPPLYALQATDLLQWDNEVLLPAFEIIKSIMKNEEPFQDKLQPMESLTDEAEINYCDICEKTFFGKRTWEIHVKSKKHKKMKNSLQKKLRAAADN